MQGEARAWESLRALDPEEVRARVGVEYSEGKGGYVLPVFGFPVTVDPSTCTLKGSSPESEFVLAKAAYFSRLSILHYLIDAQRIMPTGHLVKPSDLKSGQIYLQGSHLLPLDKIASRFARDPEGFVKQATRFGGELRAYGDAAMELLPFPRVPVTLILWQEDDEFPARSYLLFDETCEQQLPPDILWSVAMMGCLVMLQR